MPPTKVHPCHFCSFISSLKRRFRSTCSRGRKWIGLRVLYLAGHVKATIPLPVRTLHGYDQPPATVEAVTPLGHWMLRRFPLSMPNGKVSRPARAPRKRLLGRF